MQNSFGRLSSPVFPGEALGIWPAGDFRIVRGEVSGALFAVALGAVAAGYGVVSLWRRRQFALLAMLIAGAVVYLGTRAVAEIHVQAKALAVIAPLVLLVGLRGPARARTRVPRVATGAILLRYAFGSRGPRRGPGLDPAGASRRADRRRRTPARARATRRARRGRAGRLPRRRPLRRLLPARDARPRPGRVRARGDRRPTREALAAGRCGRLRLARLGPARQVRLCDHDHRRLRLGRRRATSSRSRATATTCSGQRDGDDAAQPGAPGRGRRPGREPGLRRSSVGRPGSAPAARADRVRRPTTTGGCRRWSSTRPAARSAPSRRRARPRRRSRCRSPAHTSSRSSTTRRCRSRWSSTTRWSRSCRRRSTACT